MEYILVDTGIWIAMFDPRDPYRERLRQMEEVLELFHLVLPWPTLYETLHTRMVRNRRGLRGFQAYLKRPRISFLDDAPYREKALELCFSSGLRAYRSLSMADCLIRLVLEDVNVKVTGLATFNRSDFADVCQKRRIEMI